MSRSNNSKLVYLLLLFSLISLACSGVIIDIPNQAEVTPSGTFTATQVDGLITPTPESTATLRLTSTLSATQEPVENPSPTNSPLPTLSPSPSLTPTPTIPTVIGAGWEGLTVETVCMAVWDHYPQSVGSFSQTNEIIAVTSGLLSLLGIQSVPLGEPCEAELTVMLTFQAVGTEFSDDSVLFTGALSNGQLTLSAAERERLVLPVSSIYLFPIDPTSSENRPVNPSAAPFELVWREPVLSGLAQIWGEEVLLVGLGEDEWHADANKVLSDSAHSPILTMQPSSAGMNSSGSELNVVHNPYPAIFIPGGVSNREFTCYFQTTIKARDAGIQIVTFGMDYLVDGKQVRDLTKGTGPWPAEVFADWYACPGAFIPSGEACTDQNNWLGSDKNAPFVGIWYYHGVDEQGKPVRGEAEIECVPE